MRCPKCHYVSFEPEPRCRNCGYGFSLAEAERALADDDDDVLEPEAAPAVSPIRGAGLLKPSAPASPGPAPSAHVSPLLRSGRSSASGLLAPEPPAARSVQRPVSATAVVDEPPPVEPPPVAPAPVMPAAVAHAPVAPAPVAAPQVPPSAAPTWEPELVRTPAALTTELPLFVKAVPPPARAPQNPFDLSQDEPLVRVPVQPRPPLAVRRPAPTPDPAALRLEAEPVRPAPRKLGPLDRDLLEDLQRIELAELTARARANADREVDERVGAGTRLAAAALDALVVGGVSVGVFAITLRWCDLPFEQASTLPLLPMAAFHAIVALGYLLMFTAAGGQTIGKMAFGLRVVDDADRRDFPAVTFSQAAYRAVASLPSVLALGLGFIPALVGRERAFHDRLAHTRVVRA